MQKYLKLTDKIKKIKIRYADKEDLRFTLKLHKSQISCSKNSRAKKAILKFKVLEKMPSRTKLEINLLTGRYHQIRIQLSNFGYPIIGDKKYGSQNSFIGIGLHHYKFSFYHPVSNEFMTIKAPYPKNNYWL